MENKKFENSENLMKLICGELELESPEARKTVREMDEAMRTKEERSVYLLDCEELLRYWRLAVGTYGRGHHGGVSLGRTDDLRRRDTAQLLLRLRRPERCGGDLAGDDAVG